MGLMQNQLTLHQFATKHPEPGAVPGLEALRLPIIPSVTVFVTPTFCT
jgi:hypothetical protein